MYYRYRVKKKDRPFLKVFITLSLIGALLFGGYRYREYLAFWKYSTNKTLTELENARSVEDESLRKASLIELVQKLERYCDENPTESDGYFFSAMGHYYLGESYLPGSFSEIIINNKYNRINPSVHEEFIEAIKDIKKGIALIKGDNPGNGNIITLGKCFFFTEYKTYSEINDLLNEHVTFDEVADVEDIRFISIIKILNGEVEPALDLLLKKGNVENNLQGILFLATTEKLARKYTQSIVTYKMVITKTEDPGVHKLVRKNLGDIYYQQSLYRESLMQLAEAEKIDSSDPEVKLLIGKNLLAQKYKDKAKAVLTEAWELDKANSEIKDLLESI